jgi:alpha-1,2-mannosyltransferase
MLCCWWAQVQSVMWFLVVVIAPCATVLLLIRLLFVAKRRRERDGSRQTVGFFHPYCNAGGGGERVLWAMVQAVQSQFPELDVVIYTGDVNVTEDQILGKVSQNLQMNLMRKPHFVYLHHRKWVEANMFPYFTLLGQSVGSLILGAEAVIRFTPDYYIDTMGYSFTYPLFRLIAGCRVACYTHYPTISSEMLELISSSSASFNNRHWIASSRLFTSCKLLYYRLFGMAYAFSGHFADVIMVNSSWTRNHITSIWGLSDRTHLIFPPCDTTAFQSLDLRKKERFTIISVAQFRPEKEHKLQLTAFKRFTELVHHVTGSESSRIILVGSCRNQEDEERVAHLRRHAQELGLPDHQVSHESDSPAHK